MMKKKKSVSKKKEKKRKPEEKKKVEKSDLEIDIEKIEKELQPEKLPDFNFEDRIIELPSEEVKAPVLERTIRQEPMPVDFREFSREETGERIEYAPTNEPNYNFARTPEDEEKKYETKFVPPVLTRRQFLADMREELKPQNEAWSSKTNEKETITTDNLEEQRRLPFEQQRKYKRHKLR
jgi:hypothetical protein